MVALAENAWIGFVIFQIIATFTVAVLAINSFVSHKKSTWYAYWSSIIGWFLCFAIVLLIPVDIIEGDVIECRKAQEEGQQGLDCNPPFTYLPSTVLTIEWNILYWGTFALSWFVYPFLTSYWLAGDFTKFEKFFTSFKENIYIYVIMGVLGGSFLGFLTIKDDLTWDGVRQTVVLLANIYGLTIIILLMGYGLVDIPRYLFRKANRNTWLNIYCERISNLRKDKQSYEEKLTDNLKSVRLISEKISADNQLRPFVDVIISKCPPQYKANYRRIHDETFNERVTYDMLVDLHQKVMKHDHAFNRASILYERTTMKALNLQDIIASRASLSHTVLWSFKPPRTGRLVSFRNRLEWYWQTYLHTWFYRLMGVLCSVMSVVIVWCEVILPVSQIDLSPLSIIITQVPLTGVVKQFYAVVIVSYMATCAYTSLFKLQIWDYYMLVSHQQSDDNSIMFSANYLCRLAAPLSFNFLLLTKQKAPAFEAVMGKMQGLFEIGKVFIYVFPVFVVVFFLFTLFNGFQRIARSRCMKWLLGCWPIKKLHIQIPDKAAARIEGANILRQERDNKEAKATSSEPLTTMSSFSQTETHIAISTPPPRQTPVKQPARPSFNYGRTSSTYSSPNKPRYSALIDDDAV
eukprot:TRINITY_DN3740_c0_g1_i1.p1 TRINITY_DN3740_c0_g1~~TRINITY_DN3740_c0_g1_i1.p1  ORF type:complete len:632 (-),score=109.80 TRINITY_DN3740_c0_g1_i1:43-1938(-)